MYCKCHRKSILEVKCPYNIQNLFIKKDINKCSFHSKDNGDVTINKGHKYYTQVISQIQLSIKSRIFIIYRNCGKKTKHFVKKVSISLESFFKRFVAINLLKFWGTCQKLLLEKLEIGSKETNMQSICCNQCRI